MPEEKGLRFAFFNDNKEGEDHTLHFYDHRSSTKRGQDNDHPQDQISLVMYAVEFHCQNPIVDTKRNLVAATRESRN